MRQSARTVHHTASLCALLSALGTQTSSLQSRPLQLCLASRQSKSRDKDKFMAGWEAVQGQLAGSTQQRLDGLAKLQASHSLHAGQAALQTICLYPRSPRQQHSPALSLDDGLQSGSILTELDFQQAVELVEALISLIKDTNQKVYPFTYMAQQPLK